MGHSVSPSSYDCSSQQAQTYFAGQSRYIGVYDSSRLAARAYVVVQDFLRQYRTSCPFTRDTPREALAAVFATARQVADDAVRQLLNDDDEVIFNASDPSGESRGRQRKANVAVPSSVEKVRETAEAQACAIKISNSNSRENAASETQVTGKETEKVS
jgi:hypothetical protein